MIHESYFFVAELTTCVVLVFTPMHTQAASVDSSAVPYLRAGAIELGLAGSITALEDISNASISVRTGTFTSAVTGLAGFELELSYTHRNSLDLIDLQGDLSWQHVLGKSSGYPFIAFGGGVRQEWLGSFQQVRYPIGFNLGIRTLVAQQAAVRVEYKFRRILHDPVSNFTEHQLVLGVSIFFKNSR